MDTKEINVELYKKSHTAKSLINSLGDTLDNISVDTLVEHIKIAWDDALNSVLKKNLANPLTINEWCEVIVKRKPKEQEPVTA